MFRIKYIFCFILLHFISATPQFNLHHTDVTKQGNGTLEHTCLRIVNRTRGWNRMSNLKITYGLETDTTNEEIMSYCLNEFTPEFYVKENYSHSQKLTFSQLSKENISSRQLYFWSAPLDLIEKYQFYLNQLPASNGLSLAQETFYNCTLPSFGPQCQYEFDHGYSSLTELLNRYYTTNDYDSTTFTCYKHLQCYRGPSPVCLDWSEICNGHIDCTDGGLDEAHCWQLATNQCNDDQYQCDNGQCIPKVYYQDDKRIFDCIDGSDELLRVPLTRNLCGRNVPAFACEDRICKEEVLTSSCVTSRNNLLMSTIFTIKDNFTVEECWFAIRCMFDILYSEERFCYELHANNSHLQTLLNTCPKMLYLPNYPVAYGDTYIAAQKSDLIEMSNSNAFQLYICYNHLSRFDESLSVLTEIRFENRTCFQGNRLAILVYDIGSKPITKYYKFMAYMYTHLRRYRLPLNYTSTVCHRSNMYKCLNSSKCILMHRFFDGYIDCPYVDDNKMSTLIINPQIEEHLNKTHFYCQAKNKYLSQNLINDYKCDCQDTQVNRCTDEDVGDEDSARDILFQTICNQFQELLPVTIENRNETDETECEQWECHNIYTHCDGVWNCRNGADEIGCDEISRTKCSSNEHLCVSTSNYRLGCLNISKVNDGSLDCIGGTDEPRRIIHSGQAFLTLDSGLTNSGSIIFTHKFSCMNQTPSPDFLPFMLCDGFLRCEHGDDEKFCETDQTHFGLRGICLPNNIKFASHAERLLCSFLYMKYTRSIIYFKLDHSNNLAKKTNENVGVDASLPAIEKAPSHKFPCHRGLSFRLRSNNETDVSKIRCFCPPSYYGDYCQYQNQRISVVIRFRAFSDSWQTQFVIVLLLVDGSDDRIIHSYEQINYLSLKNCRTKFHLHLLYSTRPKDPARNYSIHIDIYEKKTLTHRGSILFPVLFPFLPVHRLAFLVDIPTSTNARNQICSDQRCHHGTCIKYTNNRTFCQCAQGWSGRFCTRQYTHQCSSDSLPIGVLANNRSICVCSTDTFGPRCLLKMNAICHRKNDTHCKHGGECILNTLDAMTDEEFTCACRKGYSGDRCEIKDTEISMSVHPEILLSQVVFIHFIRAIENATHLRSTTFRSIPMRENVVTLTWAAPFHIAFAELSESSYYLIEVRSVHIPSQKITKMISSADHCPHISELLTGSFVQWHLRRIKYYHLVCRNQSSNISCFYDDVQFCLCYQFGQKRLANCFNFDHNMVFNCEGHNGCENNAKCFQDLSECPTKSVCMCPSCFFGQRCELTTNGLGLSLDVILGYQILPHISIDQQPFIIKLNLAITIIFIVAGLLNVGLSLITFTNTALCEVGCGLYLLAAAVTALCTTTMFGLKFFVLLFSHMSLISDRVFLSGQCYSFDFILRTFLSMDQWLNACVAIERTLTVIKGANFNKKKSKNTARFVIVILFVIIAMSYAHDPFHRKLMDETNDDDSRQNRIWCIVSYPPRLETYNSCIQTLHVIGPFVINFMSVIVLIIQKSRQESNLHKKQPYKEILRKTIKEHRHLLTAPVVLVGFGIPRIILIFTSKCMKSASDAWVLLIGHSISFIPSMLLFLIFVLPSTFYRQTFHKTVVGYITNILRRFGLIQ